MFPFGKAVHAREEKQFGRCVSDGAGGDVSDSMQPHDSDPVPPCMDEQHPTGAHRYVTRCVECGYIRPVMRAVEMTAEEIAWWHECDAAQEIPLALQRNIDVAKTFDESSDPRAMLAFIRLVAAIGAEPSK